MKKLVCMTKEKMYIPIEFYGGKAYPVIGLLILQTIVDSDALSQFVDFNNKERSAIKKNIEVIQAAYKNYNLPNIGTISADYTRVILATEMDFCKISEHVKNILKSCTVIKGSAKKAYDYLYNNSKNWTTGERQEKEVYRALHEEIKRKGSIINKRSDLNVYIQRIDEQFEKGNGESFIADLLHLVSSRNIIGNVTYAKVIASGDVSFEEREVDNYQTKSYAVFVSKEDKYLNENKALVSLSQARIFPTDVAALNFAEKYYTTASVVELLLSFNGSVANRQKFNELNGDALEKMNVRAEKDKIKQSLSAEKIETMQFENLAFKKYCQKHNLNYSEVLKEISDDLFTHEDLINKTKAQILSQELEKAVPLKNKTKTL